jgi:crossover junction endodeoxyribonuclease RuvC
MIALGIDPGTRRVGYGIVSCDAYGHDATFVDAGLLTIAATEDADAFEEIRAGIDKLIETYRPDTVAVEKLFFAKNTKTAIAVAQARGVILLAIKARGVCIKEYTPNEVKLGVAGYGAADKKAVLKMVRLILRKPDLAVIDDASDALALAILSTGDRLLDTAR